MGGGFQQLAIRPMIDAVVQIATEELTPEELMRIWHTLPLKYSLTAPYVGGVVRTQVAVLPVIAKRLV